MTEEYYIKAVEANRIPEDDVIGVDVNGYNLAVYNVEGEFFATDNICTHGNAKLCDGFLDGHRIECPLHQGEFDVRSGKACTSPLTEDIKAYPTKVGDDGFIYISMIE